MISDRVTEGRASEPPILDTEDMQKHGPPPAPDPERKHPIHLPPTEKHNRSIIIYVTTCSEKRRSILASPHIHHAILNAWRGASTWLVGRYVVMPDHIHFFCAPNGADAPSVERWMRYWKSNVARGIGANSGEIWQRHHWDRQLRSRESYAEKWESVWRNPVRRRLSETPDERPYQGELNVLPW